MNFKAEVNDRIRAYQVRVIDEEGAQKGVMSLRDALHYASSKELDLVRITDSMPPVCKVVNANKFFYEQQKSQQAAAKKQRAAIITVKEVQLKVSIDTNDLKIKARKAKGFLAEGDKVKVVCRFRGREVTHKELGFEVMKTFMAEIGEHKVEKHPSDGGRELMAILAPTPAMETKRLADLAAKEAEETTTV